MKILVDENIPLVSVKALRSLGHDVTDIRGTQDQGLTDIGYGNYLSKKNVS